MNLRDERAGIITGWLFKIVLSLAILGVALFEAGSVILAKVSVDRIAIEAADEAGLEYGRTRSSTKAQQIAERVAGRQDAEVVGKIKVYRDLDQVTVTVRKQATTLVLEKIGFLRRYTLQTATHNGRIK